MKNLFSISPVLIILFSFLHLPTNDPVKLTSISAKDATVLVDECAVGCGCGSVSVDVSVLGPVLSENGSGRCCEIEVNIYIDPKCGIVDFVMVPDLMPDSACSWYWLKPGSNILNFVACRNGSGFLYIMDRATWTVCHTIDLSLYANC